jgi:hypothetical protein
MEERMSRYLAGLAALALVGAAALPLQADAAERHAGISKPSTDLSAQRYWRGRYYGHRYYGHRYWGPRYRYYGYRHHWGPRYGYYGYRHYGYRHYGYPYGYYRPGPFVSFGVGPIGFRAF